MGYRSDVVLTLTREGVADLKKAFAEADLDEESMKQIVYLLEHPDKHLQESDGSELWFWESIKWYYGDPDIDFIESFISSHTDNENYRFMRIGEDYDDVEVEGCYCDDPFDLRINRSIEFDERIPQAEFKLPPRLSA